MGCVGCEVVGTDCIRYANGGRKGEEERGGGTEETGERGKNREEKGMRMYPVSKEPRAASPTLKFIDPGSAWLMAARLRVPRGTSRASVHVEMKGCDHGLAGF